VGVRAYVIEPQKLFVPYLTSVLRAAGIEVVATAEDVDGHDIVAKAPDLIFVDIDYFERGGPSTLCRIREVARRATIVAISDSNDETFAASCTISGANAIVAKSGAAETLVKAVRALGPLPSAWPVASTPAARADQRAVAVEPRS
jgi:DNA-binding NarL/FixJ family response regulator